uniref:hypothetical protein n=1 Tax=Streptosporangium sp. H16 TaxID=3444184 RepID=UPI003F78ED15
MATVHRLNASENVPRLGAASEAFLATLANANTSRAYTIAIRALVDEFGERAAVTELNGEAGADRVAAWFAGRWGGAA